MARYKVERKEEASTHARAEYSMQETRTPNAYIPHLIIDGTKQYNRRRSERPSSYLGRLRHAVRLTAPSTSSAAATTPPPTEATVDEASSTTLELRLTLLKPSCRRPRLRTRWRTWDVLWVFVDIEASINLRWNRLDLCAKLLLNLVQIEPIVPID